MLGRTPTNITPVRPLKDGVIADFEAAEKMLTHFVRKVHGKRPLVRPRLVIGVPPEITPSSAARSRTAAIASRRARCTWSTSRWLPRSGRACR